jgi:hypothetical protein
VVESFSKDARRVGGMYVRSETVMGLEDAMLCQHGLWEGAVRMIPVGIRENNFSCLKVPVEVVTR